jgi:hypothetical protein
MLFFLLLLKKDHVKGEHFPVQDQRGRGSAQRGGCLRPFPPTGWLSMGKRDVR